MEDKANTPNLRIQSVLLAQTAKRPPTHDHNTFETTFETIFVPTALDLVPADCVHLIHTLAVENAGTESAFNVTLHSIIPEGTTYSVGNTVCDGAEVFCSSDGGVTYHPERDQLHVENPCTDVQFRIQEISPGQQSYFQFHLFLNEVVHPKPTVFRAWRDNQ